MNEIVLIFTHSDSWFSRLVCWLTGSRWSHVAIGVRRNPLPPLGWLGGMIDGVVDARLGSGVQPPRSWIGFLKERPNFEAFALPLPDAGGAGAFLRAQVGAHYDRWGLLSFLFPWRDWQDPAAWYCFELAAATLIAGKVPRALIDHRFDAAGGISGRDLLTFCQENGRAVTL